MSAPPRPATRGPVFTRRAITRSSLVGVGLLALTSSGLPAALADDDVAPDVSSPDAELEVAPAAEALDDSPPDGGDVAPAASIEGFFGSGKSVGFQVTYDPATAPPDLDLSGAVFTLTGGDGTHTCTADAHGYCSLATPDLGGPVPPGWYAVTQTDHSVGLAAATGTGSVHLCQSIEIWMGTCGSDPFEPVLNDSVFRSPVVGSVVDAATGAPIEGAGYTLTGPADDVWDADAQDAVDGEDASRAADPPVRELTTVSDADGVLTFEGWFLPGTEYVLTPGDPVDGYEADTETTGVEVAPRTGELAASLDARLLTPIVVPDEGDPDTTPTPVAPPTVAPTPPAPVGGGAPGGAPSPSVGGRVRPAAEVASEAAVPAAEASTAPAPSTTSVPPTDRVGDSPVLTGAPRAADQPRLATVGSSLPDKGLVMAFGLLFLVVVVVGLGLVRRHARRRG